MTNRVITFNRRRARKIKTAVFITFVLGFAAGIIWLVFFSEYLRFGAIAVFGAENIDSEDIRAVVAEHLRPQIIFFRPAGLTKALLQRFVRIKEAKFSVDIRNRTLVVKIKERAPIGFWCAVGEGKCALLGDDGIILESIDRPAGTGALIVEDARGNTFLPGAQAVNPLWLAFFIEFSRVVSPEIMIRSFLIEPDSEIGNYIRSRTVSGWDILLNVEPNEVRYFAMVLKKLLEEEVGTQLNRLQYIDLRVPGRAYYKLRN
jgi:hypothetical protein